MALSGEAQERSQIFNALNASQVRGGDLAGSGYRTNSTGQMDRAEGTQKDEAGQG